MNNSSYSQTRKDICTDLKHFSLRSTTNLCRELLHQIQNGQQSSPCWIPALIMEWAIWSGSSSKKSMRPKDFNKIYRRVDDLWKHTASVSTLGSLNSWMRRIAFQQFRYQLRIHPLHVIRQEFLFGESATDTWFASEFKSKYGISVKDFTYWAFCLMCFSHIEPNNLFTPQWFKDVPKYGINGSLRKFLDLLSLSQDELKSKIDLKYEKDKGERQHFEAPIFQDSPLLTSKSILWSYTEYCFFHRAYLEQSLMDFVYDSLKKPDANAFMGKFGPNFEQYARRLLEYSSVNFKDEKQIKSETSCGKRRTADFAIIEDDSIIILEVKGVEPSTTTQTASNPLILENALKSSLLHAISQGQNTIKSLLQNKAAKPLVIYQIILTYKQHYLSTGTILAECIGDDALNKVLVDEDGNSHFGAAELFIMSLDEFEHLIEAVKSKKTTFSSFFLNVKEDQEGDSKKCFILTQHLQKRNMMGIPNFLKNSINGVFDELIAGMK